MRSAGLYSEFKGSLKYIVRPYLKKEKGLGIFWEHWVTVSWLASNSQGSYFCSLLSAGDTDMGHHMPPPQPCFWFRQVFTFLHQCPAKVSDREVGRGRGQSPRSQESGESMCQGRLIPHPQRGTQKLLFPSTHHITLGTRLSSRGMSGQEGGFRA